MYLNDVHVSLFGCFFPGCLVFFFGEDEFMLAKIGSKIGYAGDVPYSLVLEIMIMNP